MSKSKIPLTKPFHQTVPHFAHFKTIRLNICINGQKETYTYTGKQLSITLKLVFQLKIIEDVFYLQKKVEVIKHLKKKV